MHAEKRQKEKHQRYRRSTEEIIIVALNANQTATSAALNLYSTSLPSAYPLPCSDITSSSTCCQLATHLAFLTSNKLRISHSSLPTSIKHSETQLRGHEQTFYNHLRIGHTYLTHPYLLKDEDPPVCIVYLGILY